MGGYLGERETNQWVKQKLKEGYELVLIDDKRFGYVRSRYDEEKKQVIVMNASNRQKQVLKEMQERIKG